MTRNTTQYSIRNKFNYWSKIFINISVNYSNTAFNIRIRKHFACILIIIFYF